MVDERLRTRKMRRNLSILLGVLLVSFFFSMLLLELMIIKDNSAPKLSYGIKDSGNNQEIPRVFIKSRFTEEDSYFSDSMIKEVKSSSGKKTSSSSDSKDTSPPDSSTDSSNENIPSSTGIYSADSQSVSSQSLPSQENSTGEHIYVILYLANIDGTADPIWYPFYDRAVEYHDSLDIPVVFSFFPATLHNNNGFGDIFKRMYLSDNIELVQKGFTMNETERNMHLFSVEDQKKIILAGRDYYEDYMHGLLGGSQEVNLPVTYVAPFSSFSNNTRQALYELGFKDSLGLYYRPEIGPIHSTEDFNCIQYGISFTTTGSAGRDLDFKTPEQIIYDLKHYERLDLQVLTINGDKVIPLFVHHPDFEDAYINGKINETKWNIYTETLSRLMNDPEVTFISAEESWELTHPSEYLDGEIICQYASTASALSENSGSEAIFATGAPDSPFSGVCDSWGGRGYSWNPSNWNVKSNITLSYEKMVNANNFTVIGDFDMCLDRIWLKNSKTGEILNVLNEPNSDCILIKEISSGFQADTIILETCGWAWSSTDAVQLCGVYEPVCGNGILENGEECDDENKINGDGCSDICQTETSEPSVTSLCQYASTASALSENSGSEAIFATGAPDSPFSGVCDSWGGRGYSWNPSNWNVKSNITLSYEKMVNANNFTVIGDFDMCLDRIWLKNSKTGEIINAFTGPSSECVLTRGVSSEFDVDTIILETCGWAWSSTDAVQLCGNVPISE